MEELEIIVNITELKRRLRKILFFVILFLISWCMARFLEVTLGIMFFVFCVSVYYTEYHKSI